jgi:hypothetical protein
MWPKMASGYLTCSPTPSPATTNSVRAAVGVTVLPYLARLVNQARQLRRESPVAYLLAADRKLARRRSDVIW